VKILRIKAPIENALKEFLSATLALGTNMKEMGVFGCFFLSFFYRYRVYEFKIFN